MGLIGILSGLGLAATAAIGFAVAKRSRHGADAYTLAVVMAAVWVSARWADYWVHIPASMLIYPVLDIEAMMLTMALWNARPAPWKLMVAGAFLVQLVCHVVFWARHDPSDEALRRYIFALNVMFAIQLGSTSAGGLWDVGHGARYFRRLLDRRRARDRPFHGSSQ